MQRNEFIKLLEKHGAFILKVDDIKERFNTLANIPVVFPDGGSMLGSVWYMTEIQTNIEQTNKKSVYLFDPYNNPGQYGESLTDINELVKKAILPSGESLADYLVRTDSIVANGIHYYTSKGSLKAHNDINRLTILYSDGGTSVDLGGVWYKIGRGSCDNSDYVLEDDELIAMWGISTYLETRLTEHPQLPIFHRVDELPADKVTYGMFIEDDNRDLKFELPGGLVTTKGMFQDTYFRSIPIDDSNQQIADIADGLRNNYIGM